MSNATEHRQSNIELLRIICMLFVVMQHFWGHALYPQLQSSNDTTSPAASFITLGFMYIAVNCFVLISGYFRIKTTLYKFVSFTFLVIFYNFLSLAFLRLAGGGTIGRSLILSTFINCYNNWWFINCYVYLMLVAPILNKAIEQFTSKQLLNVIIFISIADLILGYLMNMDNGYSFIHFIFLYVIGAYISKERIFFDNLKHWHYLLIYIICALLWGLVAFATSGKDVYFKTNLAYNNPIIIIASIAFFNLFRKLSFSNSLVNKIASLAIASYLIQDGIGRMLYPWFEKLFYNDSVLMNNATMIVGGIVWFIGCSFIEILRQYIWRGVEKTATLIPPLHLKRVRKNS